MNKKTDNGYFLKQSATFLSNHNVHKSSCDLGFWASDPLIGIFLKNLLIKGSEAQKQRAKQTLMNIVIWQKCISNIHFSAILNLASMAVQYMPCPSPYFPIPYGCWCGITIPFPARHDPIDTFDEKCKIHDYCYEDAIHIEVLPRLIFVFSMIMILVQ